MTRPVQRHCDDMQGCVPVAPDEMTDFSCAGCGDCCRKRKDLRLSGADIYFLSCGLQLPPEIVVRSFCRVDAAPQSAVSAVWMKPVPQTANCPFYYRKGCSVYPYRPIACRLYPFAQQVDENGAAAYFYQQPDCGSRAVTRTLREYLMKNGVPVRAEADAAWAREYLRIENKARQILALLPPGSQSILKKRILRGLYYDYTIQEDFLPQFERNVRRIDADLQRAAENRAVAARENPQA